MFQQFPNGKRWEVDMAAAAAVGLGHARVQREVDEMGRAFPRWILTVARDRELQTCQCGGLLVFERGLRCVMCDRAPKPNGALAWFGLLPPIGIDGLDNIKAKLLRTPPAKHLVGTQAGLGSYLLVPLVATYADEFPRRPVRVFYLPEFKKIPGMPQAEGSHEFHMLPGGQMCLFGGNEWTPTTTCREVLQQRAYPHVIKMLNYANGKKSAFAIVTK